MWLIRKLRSAALGLALLLTGTAATGCLSPGGISLTQSSINVSLSASAASKLPGSKVTSGALSISGAVQSSSGSSVGH